MRADSRTELALFVVRNGSSGIEFTHTAPHDSALSDFHELRVDVAWEEVKRLAARLSCHTSEEAIYPETREEYDRILIFCALRPHISHAHLRDLFEVVLGLNAYDLIYWSMHLKRVFWSDEADASLVRIATAFKYFFGLL